MLTMSYHTIVLTLSPIAASLWAWLLFDTHPGVQEALGGAAVIAGVAIVSLGRRSKSNEKGPDGSPGLEIPEPERAER